MILLVVSSLGSLLGAVVPPVEPLGASLFAGPIFPTGAAPSAIVAGDLDRDGDQDLAVANRGSGTVSILLNRGTEGREGGEGAGGLAPHVEYATGAMPLSIALADLDRDGDDDLVTANYHAHTVSVLLNAGDGTFAEQRAYATEKFPVSVIAGDVDQDGDVDLAVANHGGRCVSVLTNEGHGVFDASVKHETGARPPAAIALGDLDRDGDVDLAVALGDRSVAVLVNDGHGVFSAPVIHATSALAERVAIGDFDRDGDADVAVAGYRELSVLVNDGERGFTAAAAYTTGADTVNSLVVGDLDADEDDDLVCIGYEHAPSDEAEAGRVCVFLNQRDGTLALVPSPTLAQAGAIAIADMDLDGRADLAATGSGGFLLPNAPSGVFLLRGRGNGQFAAFRGAEVASVESK